ncbi:KGK domain-containing protein [Chroococcus sp. FPU101]|uniref:KGK domain-containing protein n=1 Tax=Chroococcus sp. FPU101 TaxID=1974212 RepID=UPI001A8E0A2B|nr:KGK domain-containing protein [Chroococcus sp. FPU101]GFE70114.1 hypothetical protein CFPU101_27240 [Chroococcus sp. FPU101]
MKPHSYLANLNDDDLIEFSNNSLMKIGKLRKALKQVFNRDIEDFIKNFLRNEAIKIYPATQIYYPDGTTKIHQNNWFSSGVACKLLKLGNKSWNQGTIKIRVEVEFFPNEKSDKTININDVIDLNLTDFSDSLTIQSIVDDEFEQLRCQLEEL